MVLSLALAPGAGFAQATNVFQTTNELQVTYTACRFAPEEGWRTRGEAMGNTRLTGREWEYDFAQGAPWLSLVPADRTLPGVPERFRLRVYGAARGHPIIVSLHTHFMTFHKRVGEFGGVGEQELVFDGPPGPGWEWFGGENDGKIHGPLRLGEVRLEANGLRDHGRLELLGFTVEGKCPADRLCAMTADAYPRPKDRAFRVQIQSLARENLYGVLEWTVRDWQKKVLDQGQRQIVLPILGAPAQLDLRVPGLKGKLQFAEAEFELVIEGQKHPRVQAYWLNPPTSVGRAELRPESPFGMGLYLGRFESQEMERTAARAQEAGVKWSREDFRWSAIEPRAGQYEWAFTDELVACARRRGITVYAIVASWPDWTKAYTPEGIDRYVAFLRVLVNRYHDRIKQWEIWNEPNIFFWQGTKEQYAELLTKSYQAIKEVDPGAEVLGLSTAGIDSKYIQWMIDHQAPFDVLTIHPYRKTFEDQAFMDDLKKVSDLVRRPDGRRRPVWLTELGWATHVPHPVVRQDFEPNSQRTQAEILARAYLCALASGVEPRTFWYDFRDDGDDPFYFEHNLGILRADMRPKAAFLAYQTLTRSLEGLRYAGAVEVGAGTFAYRFAAPRRSSHQVCAVWNPKQDATIELKVTGRRAKVTNTIGETSTVETARIPGEKALRSVRVTLKAGAVVYVETE